MEDQVNNQNIPINTSVSPLESPNNLKKLKNNKLLIITCVIFIFLLISGSLYILSNSLQNETELKLITTSRVVTKVLHPSNTPTSNSSNFVAKNESDSLATYVSPDSKYSLIFYSGETNEIGTLIKCKFSVKENSTKSELKITDFYSDKFIGCDNSMGNFSSNFVQWTNHTMVIEDDNQIKLIDLDNKKVTTHNFDSTSLIFNGVDKTLQYWLFYDRQMSNGNNKFTYLLLDSQN